VTGPEVDVDKVDALFVGDPPPPPEAAAPVLRRLRALLWVAIPLNILGIPCWTGVPGAALTLWAWLVADGEMARVDAGAYHAEDAAALVRMRRLSAWVLGFCLVSLVIQVYLLSTPAYGQLHSWILGHFR